MDGNRSILDVITKSQSENLRSFNSVRVVLSQLELISLRKTIIHELLPQRSNQISLR